MAVSALSIVEHLDVIEDIRPRQLARVVNAFLDPFLVQRAEERLDDGVDAPISSGAPRFRHVGQYQREKFANDIAL